MLSGPWRWAAAELRLHWRATLVLVLLVGLGAGAVLAAVAGAGRTATAFERFREESLAGDARVQIGEDGAMHGLGPAGEEVVQSVRAMSEVESVAVVDLFIGSNPASSYDVGVIAGSGPMEGALGRPRLVDGRFPDPTAEHEVLTNEVTAAEAGLEVGDTFTIETFTPEQLALIEDEFTGFGGPALDLRLVGVVRLSTDLLEESAGAFYGTPAFHARHLGEAGSYGGVMEVRLHDGVDEAAAVQRLREVVAAVDGLDEVDVQAAADQTARVTDATAVLAQGLLAFAAAAALATLVAVGQALSRRLSALAPDQATLDALGCTRAQRLAGAALTVVPVAAGGAVLAVAVAVAVAASPLLPIGVARTAEPDPGLHVDPVTLGLGAVAVTAAVFGLGLVAASRLSSIHRWDAGATEATGRLRRSAAAAASARAGAPAPAVLGVAMALEAGRGRTAVPVRPALVGAVFGTAGIVGALTFGASLDRLVSSPAAYGWTFDLAPSVYEEDREAVLASDDIEDAGEIELAQVEIGGRTVQGMAMRPLKGDPALMVVDGRAPAGPGEVALGGVDLAELGLRVGDEVAVRADDGSERALEVVGEAIFPVLDGNAFDSGGLLDPGTLQEVQRSGGFDQLVIGWADGVDPEAAEARLADEVPDSLPVYAYPTRPGSVANLAGVASLPQVLAGFLVVVALAAIGHALVAAVIRRRRDLAVVRVFGFVRRQVAGAVAWQSVTLAAVGLLVGIPLGIAAGRVLWAAVADGIGVPASPVVPVPYVLSLVPLTIVAGLGFALLPARAAVRNRPVDGLRVE